MWPAQSKVMILVYAVYGLPDAKRDKHRKRYNEALLQAVADDTVSRGNIMAVVAGDFNMDEPDSLLMQRLLWSGVFWNTAQVEVSSGLVGRLPTYRSPNG
eukprot:5532797-Prorocentrum_lima.AAC.1